MYYVIKISYLQITYITVIYYKKVKKDVYDGITLLKMIFMYFKMYVLCSKFHHLNTHWLGYNASFNYNSFEVLDFKIQSHSYEFE